MFNITSTLPIKRRWKDAQGNEFIETGAMILATGFGFRSVNNSVWQVPPGWPDVEITQRNEGDDIHFQASVKVPKLLRIE